MNKFKRIIVMALAVMMVATTGIVAFADDGTESTMHDSDMTSGTVQNYDFTGDMTKVTEGITGNVTSMLPALIALFALGFGLGMIPKLVRKFGSSIGG